MEINLTIIRYLVTLLYGVITTAAFANILHRRKNIIWLSILIVCLSLIQFVMFVTVGFDKIIYLYPLHTHLILIAALVWIYKCSFLNAAVYTLLAYMCCQIPAWISKLAVYTKFDSGILEFVIYLTVVLLSEYIIIRYAGAPIHNLISGSRVSAMAYGAVPFTYYLFDYCTTVWTQILYTGNYHVTQFMPMVICVVYLIFAVVFSKEQEKRRLAREEQTILENELHIVESEMDNLKELEHMSRIYRHDMRHHLTLVLRLLEQYRTQEAREYILENIKSIDSITPRRFCDREMLNLLLSHFAGKAERMKAEYEVEINLPEEIPLSNTEICTMVSNALENAFNAVEALPQNHRRVDLKLREFNGKLIFSVDNTCDDHVCIVDNRPQAFGDGHGYGTRSISAIANEHHGMAKFEIRDGIFSLMVIIPL